MSATSRVARVGAVSRALSSVRGRSLFVVVTVTALTVLLIGAVTHWVRLGELETSVLAGTAQEAGELQRLLDRGPAAVDGAENPPPQRWESPEDAYDQEFETVDDLLWTFMSTSVPAPNEVIVGVVDGEVTYTYDGPAGEGLSSAAIEAAVAQHGQRGRTVHTTQRVEGRVVGFGLIHVRVPGDPEDAYLVVATDLTEARQDVVRSWWRYAGIATVVLGLAAVVSYFLLGRVTAPISRLRDATEAISPQDLTQRVEVPGHDSDVARLAWTFNSMLDRIQDGFEEQRQLLDDAAHELRTPLTILHGNLELLDEHDPQDAAETRDLMLDEISRMNRLVEDLLLLARARRPDFIRPESFDIAEFLDSAVVRVRALSDERRWVLDAASSGPLVGDRERLTQALVQLSANAVKFSSAGDTIGLGAMWVESAGRQGEPGDRMLELWVRDTGVGIAPADQERIFERFGRAAAGRTVEGSGLGLSIVSAIAAGHGGRVGLRSSPGSGSWFTLHLPAHGPLPQPSEVPGPPASTAEE